MEEQNHSEQPTDNTEPEGLPVLPEPAVAGPESDPNVEMNAVLPPVKKKRKVNLLLAVIALILLLSGGVAAAYYGVIVPNKPENVLRTAVLNTQKQRSSKFTGKATFEGTDANSSMSASTMEFKGQTDGSAFQTTLDVTVMGIEVPLELRYIDKDLFVRVGNLSILRSLAVSGGEFYVNLADELDRRLSDKWIEIDETLLKKVKVDCYLNAGTLSETDINYLLKRFEDMPFANIQSSSADTVNGKTATKFEIEIDGNKGAEYMKGVDQLQVYKKLQECSGAETKPDTQALADGGKTPITIWVDKASKTIVKFAAHSTEQSEEKQKMKGSLEITLKYEPVSITKPEGAKPLMEVFGDLAPLLNGSSEQLLDGIGTDVLGAFTIR